MTSLDTDVWERFREAGNAARENTAPPTSIDVSAWNSAAWERRFDESVKRRVEFLTSMTQLTETQAEELVRSKGVPLECEKDIAALVNAYGAAVNPENREHLGTREAPTLDTIASSLPPHVTATRGLSYQYCAMRSGGEGVQAFFSAEHLDPAIISVVRWSNPSSLFVTIEHADAERVVMRSHCGAVTSLAPEEAALWMYSLSEGHRCMTAPTASLAFATGDRWKFVDMEQYCPNSTSLEMRVSSLLRCPNQPTRHLDMDMLLFDHRIGAVVGVVEHAHMGHTRNPYDTTEQDRDKCWKEVASKPTTQTRAAASRFGCCAYRVIDHAALGTVAHLLDGAQPQFLGGIDGLLSHICRA